VALKTRVWVLAERERSAVAMRTSRRRIWAPNCIGITVAELIPFGRKRKLSDYQRAEALRRRAAGETLARIAKSYAVDISMISRL
jgi:hypothetical protein